MNCFIAATFDWQKIINVRKNVCSKCFSKKIKKSGLHFCFLFLNWKILVLKYSQYSSNDRGHMQKKFHGDLECLQNCVISGNYMRLYTISLKFPSYVKHLQRSLLINVQFLLVQQHFFFVFVTTQCSLLVQDWKIINGTTIYISSLHKVDKYVDSFKQSIMVYNIWVL